MDVSGIGGHAGREQLAPQRQPNTEGENREVVEEPRKVSEEAYRGKRENLGRRTGRLGQFEDGSLGDG